MSVPQSSCYTGLRLVRSLAVVIAIAAGSIPASATTDAEDLEMCKNILIEEHAATNVNDLKHVHHEDIPYVYGNADFKDINGLHFRCKIYNGKVRRVRFLVKDPEFVNGRAWAKERPHGPEHEGLELDAAASAPPPLDHPSPHFVRVPQQP